MTYMDCSDWSKCNLCGDCLVQCPVMQMDRSAASASVRDLISGVPVEDVFSRCTLCFNCNNYCPKGLRPHELILQRVLENRKKPVTAILPYLMNGMPGPNLFMDLYAALDDQEKEILDTWSAPPAKSDEMLFVGCIGRISCLDLENSTVLADIPKFGPRDLCCGELHYRAGSWEAFEDRAKATLSRLEDLQIKRMVCYCASCYTFFSRIMPLVYGKSLPFETVSLYQWLWERVESGRLAVKKPLNCEAAISESCYVSELGPQFAATLRKLYGAAGMTLRELPHHGENNLSCGAVSFARNQNIFKSMLSVQRAKYSDAKQIGAKDMALNCPGCFLTLGFTSFLHGIRLRYMPDELLAAFGDDVSRPLKSRMPLIVRTALMRAPLAVKRVDPKSLR
ncbi:MAG: (Fe-S)-binding protein [Desulfatibacillaceae bacterium]|nr:(Fe-S)-binding protein [Desulfatibacillaceae bacterium]